MKPLYKYLLTLLSISLFSCEEVVNVDLETAAPQLVIDASIDWVKGTTGREQKIIISTTTEYYSTEFPTVSGASVVVTNSANIAFDFIETLGNGEYVCNNFTPVLGETYTLEIVLNGEVYTSTETLMGVPEIEDGITQNNAGGFGGDEIEIEYKYQDDGQNENFYLHRIVSPVSTYPEYKAQDDEQSQGNLMRQFFSDENLKAGDVVNIRLYGISKRYYDYFRKLLSASGAEAGPFQTTPGSVRGNIINQTHSSNFTYGYFRLSEVDVKDYTIQ
jgi:hypothetical protein